MYSGCARGLKLVYVIMLSNMAKIDRVKAFIIGMGVIVLVLSMTDLYSEGTGGHSHGNSSHLSQEHAR